jgi:diaminopimelate epimerase
MNLRFIKYHGTGNDFILVDNRDASLDLTKHEIAHLCNRRFGIGADGLMLLNRHYEHDFEMKYFNSDGGEGSMCGNGGRCIAAFAKHLGIVSDPTKFLASDGVHKACHTENGIELRMNDLSIAAQNGSELFLDSGSPHLVIFSDNIKDLDVATRGRKIRYSDRFKPAGTNVNFVEYVDQNQIFVRTYERGVEDETYSCGTGAVASSLAAVIRYKFSADSVTVKTIGGELLIKYKKQDSKDSFVFHDIWLCGPAKQVYSGTIEL